jgi:hypothetical protein
MGTCDHASLPPKPSIPPFPKQLCQAYEWYSINIGYYCLGLSRTSTIASTDVQSLQQLPPLHNTTKSLKQKPYRPS